MKKNVFKRLNVLFLLLLFVFSLVCCNGDEPGEEEVVDPESKYRFFYDCFDTVCTIYDYSGLTDSEFDALASDVEGSARHYHKLFDAYTEYSGVTNIATLNRLAGTGPVKVSAAIIDLIEFSRNMYKMTYGKVNFAMGSVTYLWKSLPALEDRIPTAEELETAGAHASPDSVITDRENLTVEITDPSLRIDVGAIAKGYTAELIKGQIKAAGYSSIVLDFGGNLCAVGAKPSGKGWESAIKNPLYYEGGEAYVRRVTLINAALVTSGTYERYYIIDGEKYHHIIDPETSMPSNKYLSVSVMTADSGKADALTTALFNMDFSAAEDFVRSFGERIEVTFVFNDGSYQVVTSQ
ncbi:MAG: FAD:protein FMN transferase [Clostridia bacterium]|nr:FAD:protein FMN transferase [Clostridia bacterium]